MQARRRNNHREDIETQQAALMSSSHRRSFAGLAAAVALFPTSVGAQTVAQSFDELQGTVKVGQIVFVTDESGRLTKGKVADLSASSLTVLAPEKRTFGESTVTRINRADGVWNGALIGLGVGAIPGAWLGTVYCDECQNRTGPVLIGVLLFGGIGAAIGGGFDVLFGKVGRLVYTSRRLPLQSQRTGVIVSPLIGKDRRGVLLSVRF